MGRPKKPIEDTVRGQKAIKAQQKEEERIRKQQVKEENKVLAAQGLVRDHDGEILSFSDLAKKKFEEAPPEAQVAIKNAGKYWHDEKATEEQQEKQKEEGRGWYPGKATFEEQWEVAGAGRD